jgi:transposase InsO family protein
VLKISDLPNRAKASSSAARQNDVSILLEMRRARTARLAQSMLVLPRKTSPKADCGGSALEGFGSRQVVGFATSERMTTHCMAWFRRRPTIGLIFYSDRASQYASGEFQKQRVTFGMKASMSRMATAGTTP